MGETIPRVGFVGLGRMGLAKAKHLLRAGYDVSGFDIRETAMETASRMGVVAVPSASEVARNSDTIIVIVPTDEDVKTACIHNDGVLAGAKTGSTIVLCSSLRPETVKEIIKHAEDGVKILDAPSTRGPDAADAGTLAILVGGELETLEHVRPVLECFSEVIHHVGPLGAGQVAKTVNNILLWCNMRTTLEVLTLAKDLELDPESMRRAMFDCSGDSWALRRLDKINPAWPVKDMNNAMALADKIGCTMPMTALMAKLSATLTQEAVEELLGA